MSNVIENITMQVPFYYTNKFSKVSRVFMTDDVVSSRNKALITMVKKILI